MKLKLCLYIRLSLTVQECFGSENADGCFPVVPAIAGQKSVTSPADGGKILEGILKIGKAGLERLLDDAVVYRQHRHELLEVSQDLLGVPGGNLFPQAR